VLTKLKIISDEILKEISLTDDITNEVYKSYVSFKDNVEPWTNISDKSYLNIR
jgi:TRAP-type mannitol/chloroaromatic compound transport system substrate-binding protein